MKAIKGLTVTCTVVFLAGIINLTISCFNSGLKAQNDEQNKAENKQGEIRQGVKYGILPVFSFNTDDGVVFGLDINRYQYGDENRKPFENFMNLGLYLNSDGAFSVGISRDQVRTFGTTIRSTVSGFIAQNFGNYYLGKTDEIDFDQARFDSTSYYSFKSFTFNTGFTSRYPLYLGEGVERMDIKTGFRFVYESPWGNPENRMINSANVTASDGAFLTLLDLAFIIERRNSEFRAMRGFLVDAGIKYAPPVISSHHVIRNYVNVLGFIPLIEKGVNISLATRFNFENTLGESPYWFKPYLGGASQLRGYMYRRFSSDNIIAYNVELRSWLISIPFKNIELGLNFFMDGGREFSNNHWAQVFKDHKRTLGFGGVMSIFTPDYILKYDIGFSEDGVGIYLGTGYSF